MSTRRLIVVVGVNGPQGSSVIEALLEYPDEWYIRGTTEDLMSPDSQELAQRGVEMVQCNISNREECSRAFADAYGVFSLNKYWNATNQDECEQALNLVEAAREANVQYFITSGLPDTTAFEESQFDVPSQPIKRAQIEIYIRQLPRDSTFPHVTFVHMGFYYQNFATFFVPDPVNLEFRYPLLSHARIPVYHVHDTGKIVRECFRHPDQWDGGQIVPIVAEQLTMDEICTTIQQVTGKDIHFVPLSYKDSLLKLHRETVNNLRWYNDIGSIDGQQAEKTKKIWPQMKTFADWIRETQWLME